MMFDNLGIDYTLIILSDSCLVFSFTEISCQILSPSRASGNTSFTVITKLGTLPMVTWSCQEFPFALVPTLTFMA